MLTITDSLPCSALSTDSAESILGTAPHVTRWVLIEHGPAFGNDAWLESSLPESARAHIDLLLKNTPLSKVLLIRDSGSIQREGYQIYVCEATHDSGEYSLLKREIRDYEELTGMASIDTKSLQRSGFDTCEEVLALVCTNGRRDPCCARLAFPVYRELSQSQGLKAFECSHLGQHRFAPNVLVLPQGVMYGRLGLDAFDRFLSDLEAGSITPGHLRGRTSFPPPAQAAEYFLVTEGFVQTGDQIRLGEVIESEPNTWQVSLSVADMQFKIALNYHEGGQPLKSSCVGNKTHIPGEFALGQIEVV